VRPHAIHPPPTVYTGKVTANRRPHQQWALRSQRWGCDFFPF